MERRPFAPGWRRDAVIAIAAGAIGVWREAVSYGTGARPLDLPLALLAATQVVAGVALMWRRSHPVVTTVVVALLNLVTPTQAAFVAAWSVARYVNRHWSAGASAALLALTWTVGAPLWLLEDRVSGPLLLAVGFLLGAYFRTRASLEGALLDRAERAERERELLAHRAVDAERTRIARDMHDSIASSLNLLILRFAAIERTVSDPTARLAVADLRGGAVRVLEDLRGLVVVLRETPDGSGASTPGRPDPRHGTALDLEDLVAGVRRAGVAVTLRTTGTSRPAPTPVVSALRRAAQEGLTNATKHAPGAPVTVHLAYLPDVIGVTVTNPGVPTPHPQLVPAGSGLGLAGLSERAHLLGGVAVHERCATTGDFTLHVRLPVPATSAASERAVPETT